MKMNIFGIKSNTIGQNVIRAIEGCEQPIGILPYNYGKMIQILADALTTEEFDLISRGFGINCQRREQKIIATELGLTEPKVSEIARRAIRKLQASPYKVQLEKLVPTISELAELIESLQSQELDLKKHKKVERRLVATEKSLKESIESVKRLETENARLSYENERLAKKLTDSKVELEKLQVKIAEEKARGDIVMKAFSDNVEKLERDFHASMENAKKAFIGSLAAADMTNRTLEGLHLSKEAVVALEKIHVNRLGRLCEMTPRGLTKMVGKKFSDEIQRKLHEAGLSLRAG